MAVSKIFLICSALLIVGRLAETKVQWEASEIELSNEEHELFASKTLGEELMAPQGEEKLIVESKKLENIKQDDAEEKIEVEGFEGWEELNDPIVKGMESKVEGRDEPGKCTGGDSCCTPSNPCGYGEGDCDSHYDCKGKEVCN